jgi:hypothetical protein
MKTVQIIFRYFALFLFAVICSFLLAQFSGEYFSHFLKLTSGIGDLDARSISEFIFNYVFFIGFLIVLGGGQEKKKWLMGFLMPIILFEVLNHFSFFWFFLILIIAGCFLGWGILKLWNLFVSRR